MLALLPLVLSLVPALAGALFGPTAAKATAAVAAAAAAVTGTSDPQAQITVLQDPDKAALFTLELHKLAAAMQAEQHAAELAEMQAQFADTANARAMSTSFAAEKSMLAWAPPAISVIVLVAFGSMIALVLARTIPPGSEALANVLLGTLAGMASSVVSFWVGSSSSSRGKDATIAAANTSLANSVPTSALH